MDAQDPAAPWWRAYSEHPPRLYDSVRAPLHEAFALAVEAFSAIERPHGLGVQSIVERTARATVRDWAQRGYLTADTLDGLRWLLGASLGVQARSLVLAALEIAKHDCSTAYALELLEPLLRSKAAQEQIRVDAIPVREPLGSAADGGLLAERDAIQAREAFDRWGQQTPRSP